MDFVFFIDALFMERHPKMPKSEAVDKLHVAQST